MRKTRQRRRTAPPREQAAAPLSPRQVARRLRALPGWQAEGGNRELVGRYTLGTSPTAILAAMVVAFTAESFRRELRLELCGLRLTVRLSTPAVGAVTRDDVELAEQLTRGPMPLAALDERLAAILASTGIWQSLNHLADLAAPRREPDR
jgi:pterin-4a-carbinolamine dehydratase